MLFPTGGGVYNDHLRLIWTAEEAGERDQPAIDAP
jgi:hypothetical protein